MKKIFSAVVISTSLFCSLAFAENPKFLCKNDDNTMVVRVFVNDLKAVMQRIMKDGRRGSYTMPCVQGTGENWLVCEETAGRTFEFKSDGMSGVYHGSVKDTFLNCIKTSRN